MENFTTSLAMSFGVSSARPVPSCALLAPSVAYRNRMTIAPMTAVQGTTLLAISNDSTVSALDTVVGVKGFGTLAGIRSWSPPV